MNKLAIASILVLFGLTQYAMSPSCPASLNSMSCQENTIIIEGKKVCKIKVVDYVKSKDAVNSAWIAFNTQHDQNNTSFLIEITPERGWVLEEIKNPYYIEGDYATYSPIARMKKEDRCILIATHISQYCYTKFEKKKKNATVSIILPFNSYLEFRYGQTTNSSLIHVDDGIVSKESEYSGGLRVVSEYGTKGFKLWFLRNSALEFFLSLSPDFIDFQYVKPILPVEVPTMK